MATAGPELPPHLLAKRRRLEEAEVSAPASEKSSECLSNPRPRRSRSSSAAPTSKSPKRRRVLGPCLPASSDPEHVAENNVNSSKRSDNGGNNEGPRPRILGPSLPPAPLSERPPCAPKSDEPSSDDDDDDDDDDDFGPPPPPVSTGQSSLQEPMAESSLAPDRTPPKPKREEWMLVPPSHSDWSSRIDPTKLRNRKFNTGKGAKAPPQKSSGDNNALWTETPDQKQKRLTDEVMGVVAKSGSAAVSSSSAAGNTPNERNPRKQTEALETERRIQAYNAQHRPVSLYSEHQNHPRKKQEDDPSSRAFDREKDVVRGTKIGRAQTKEMLHRAADFGERFTKGSYL